jgi:hypothetical protein
MPVVALVTGIAAVLAGLILLAIWLIEYDPDYQAGAATRLPVPVLSGHVLLALTGLAFWIGYLLTDHRKLAWTSALILTVVVALGIAMAVRWFAVRKMPMTASAGQGGTSTHSAVPPERHFPLPVVIGHGVFAITTFVLVVLTALGVGS